MTTKKEKTVVSILDQHYLHGDEKEIEMTRWYLENHGKKGELDQYNTELESFESCVAILEEMYSVAYRRELMVRYYRDLYRYLRDDYIPGLLVKNDKAREDGMAYTDRREKFVMKAKSSKEYLEEIPVLMKTGTILSLRSFITPRDIDIITEKGFETWVKDPIINKLILYNEREQSKKDPATTPEDGKKGDSEAGEVQT